MSEKIRAIGDAEAAIAKRFQRLAPLGTYDVIKLTDTEADALFIIGNGLTDEEDDKYLENPALPHFTLFVGAQRVDFAPEPEPIFPVDTYDKLPRTVACWERGDRIGVSAFFMELVQGEKNHSYFRNEYVKLDQEKIEATRNQTYSFYLGVQKLLYERPTVFKENTAHVRVQGQARKQKGKRRKARTYRIITIDKTQQIQPDNTNPKRTIECPSWGVIGHYRNLKNGNRIWIKPHRKGKHRHQPEFYDSKEYELAH